MTAEERAREVMINLAIREAVEEEREACEKIAYEAIDTYDVRPHVLGTLIARDIRARGGEGLYSGGVVTQSTMQLSGEGD